MTARRWSLSGDPTATTEAVAGVQRISVSAEQITGPQGLAGVTGDQGASGEWLALPSFYSKLANAASVPVDVMFVGDSATEGQGSTVNASLSDRWVQQVIDSLRVISATTAKTGRGYIPAYYDLSDADGYNATAGFANTGGVEDIVKGLGRRAVVLDTAGDKLTITVTGTAVDVVFRRDTGAGTLNVIIDGGAPTGIATASSPYTFGGYAQRFTFAGGSHTVELAWASGGPVTVEGVFVHNGTESAGVRLWDAAHSGYTAASMAANLTWYQSMQAVNPDLVVVALGTNDHRTGRTATQYRADMATILGQIRSQTIPGGGTVIAPTVPIVLVRYPEPQDGTYTAGRWDEYGQVLGQLAAEYSPAIYVDLAAEQVALSADNLHPSPAGHTSIARAIIARIGGGKAAYAGLSSWLASDYHPPITANPLPNALRGTLTGNYLHINPGASTTTTYGNGVANMQCLDVDAAISITNMVCEVTTLGSAGAVVRLGLYADDGTGTRPGTLLVDAGTIDATTTGVKTSGAITVTLTPGRYWAAAVIQGAPTTTPTLRVNNGTSGAIPLPSLPNLAAMFPAASGVTGALPATCPALSATPSGTAPRIALKLA